MIKRQIAYLAKHRELEAELNYFNDESGYYEHVKGYYEKTESKKGRVTFSETSIVVVNIRSIKLTGNKK